MSLDIVLKERACIVITFLCTTGLYSFIFCLWCLCRCCRKKRQARLPRSQCQKENNEHAEPSETVPRADNTEEIETSSNSNSIQIELCASPTLSDNQLTLKNKPYPNPPTPAKNLSNAEFEYKGIKFPPIIQFDRNRRNVTYEMPKRKVHTLDANFTTRLDDCSKGFEPVDGDSAEGEIEPESIPGQQSTYYDYLPTTNPQSGTADASDRESMHNYDVIPLLPPGRRSLYREPIDNSVDAGYESRFIEQSVSFTSLANLPEVFEADQSSLSDEVIQNSVEDEIFNNNTLSESIDEVVGKARTGKRNTSVTLDDSKRRLQHSTSNEYFGDSKTILNPTVCQGPISSDNKGYIIMSGSDKPRTDEDHKRCKGNQIHEIEQILSTSPPQRLSAIQKEMRKEQVINLEHEDDLFHEVTSYINWKGAKRSRREEEYDKSLLKAASSSFERGLTIHNEDHEYWNGRKLSEHPIVTTDEDMLISRADAKFTNTAENFRKDVAVTTQKTDCDNLMMLMGYQTLPMWNRQYHLPSTKDYQNLRDFESLRISSVEESQHPNPCKPPPASNRPIKRNRSASAHVGTTNVQVKKKPMIKGNTFETRSHTFNQEDSSEVRCTSVDNSKELKQSVEDVDERSSTERRQTDSQSSFEAEDISKSDNDDQTYTRHIRKTGGIAVVGVNESVLMSQIQMLKSASARKYKPQVSPKPTI